MLTTSASAISPAMSPFNVPSLLRYLSVLIQTGPPNRGSSITILFRLAIFITPFIVLFEPVLNRKNIIIAAININAKNICHVCIAAKFIASTILNYFFPKYLIS